MTPDRVTIFAARGGEPVAVDASLAFPPLTADILTGLLIDGRVSRSTVWLRAIRAWAVEHPLPVTDAIQDESTSDPSSDSSDT